MDNNDAFIVALTSFTKVNKKLLNSLENLEKKQAQKPNRPDLVVEKVQPIEIEGFGKKALVDLNKALKIDIGKVLAGSKDKDMKEKSGFLSSLSDLLKNGFIKKLLLGVIGAGLFKEINDKTTGLVTNLVKSGLDTIKDATSGFSKAIKGIEEGASSLKNSVKDLSSSAKSLEQSALSSKETLTKTIEKMGATATASNTEKGILQKLLEKTGVRAASNAAKEKGSEYLSKIIKGTKNTAAELGSEAKSGVQTFEEFLAKQGKAFSQNGKKVIDVVAGKTYGRKQIRQQKELYEKYAENFAKDLEQKIINEKNTALEMAQMGIKKTEAGGSSIMSKVSGFAKGKIGGLLGGIAKYGGIDLGFATFNAKDIIKKYRNGEISKEEYYNLMSQQVGGAVGSVGYSVSEKIYNLRNAVRVAEAAEAVTGVGTAADLVEIPFTEAAFALAKRFLKNAAVGAAYNLTGSAAAGQLAKLSPTAAGGMANFLATIYAGTTGNSPQKFIDQLEEEATANYKTKHSKNIKTNDAIITSGGKIIQPHSNDTLYAMKDGGPMSGFFNKNLKANEEGNYILKKYAQLSNDMMNMQIRLLNDNNAILLSIADKLKSQGNIVSQNITNNSYGQSGSLRLLQGVA